MLSFQVVCKLECDWSQEVPSIYTNRPASLSGSIHDVTIRHTCYAQHVYHYYINLFSGYIHVFTICIVERRMTHAVQHLSSYARIRYSSKDDESSANCRAFKTPGTLSQHPVLMLLCVSKFDLDSFTLKMCAYRMNRM